MLLILVSLCLERTALLLHEERLEVEDEDEEPAALDLLNDVLSVDELAEDCLRYVLPLEVEDAIIFTVEVDADGLVAFLCISFNDIVPKLVLVIGGSDEGLLRRTAEPWPFPLANSEADTEGPLLMPIYGGGSSRDCGSSCWINVLI